MTERTGWVVRALILIMGSYVTPFPWYVDTMIYAVMYVSTGLYIYCGKEKK